MAPSLTTGCLVRVQEPIDYTVEVNGVLEPLHLHKGLEGNIIEFNESGHALVQWKHPGMDKGWVLADDLRCLSMSVDTEKAPYDDHGYSAPPPELPQFEKPAPRLSNPAQFAPIVFLSGTIVFLYCIYVFCHCLPLLQLTEQPDLVDKDMRLRGAVSFGVFSVITMLLIISYLRAILIDPGTIPDDDPHWQYHADESLAQKWLPRFLRETKKVGDHAGERRHCKWCRKFKPDRCHHCRVCGTCILKMDHHCPWIYNCVGYRNYKFFFLTLFYGVILTHMILWTMSESVERSLDDSVPFVQAFLTLFGVTLAASLSLILTLFWLFHLWLVYKGLSTIEMREKQDPKAVQADPTMGEMLFGDYYRSKFNHGVCQNFRDVLGDWFILWFLPVSPPSGDGLNFAQTGAPLLADDQARSMEAKRGLYVRRSAQKKRVNKQKPRDSWV